MIFYPGEMVEFKEQNSEGKFYVVKGKCSDLKVEMSGSGILLEMKNPSLEGHLEIVRGQVLTSRSGGRKIEEYEKFIKFYNEFLKEK